MTITPHAPARNLEIKVACGDDGLADAIARLSTLGTSVSERLAQVDTYFRAPQGRLKLRTIAHVREDDEAGDVVDAQLIGYERIDREGSRWSSYHVVPIPAPEGDRLRTTLSATIGTLVTVTKRRDIAIAGHTRIHLDRVEGLGAFIELETVIAGQSDADAAAEHQRIIDTLGLDRWPAVPGSYSDLLRDVSRESEARRP
ncbi:MAG: class IV adenylate cyclase [Thermomicrobiales bacterium]